MKKRTADTLILVICVFTLFLRLYFAFQTPYFTPDSYFHLRQAEAILETGKPIYHDPLSYGGRTFAFFPLFDYVLAAGALFLQLEISSKVILQLGAVLCILLAYLITIKITKSTESGFAVALLVATMPVLFKETLYRLSVHNFALVMTMFLIYCFLNIPKKWALYSYLLGIVGFSFLHPSVFIFIFGLMIYAAISKIETLPLKRQETELIVFSVFFVFWSQFLLFKQVFLKEGFAAIWQGSSLIATKITLPIAIAQIGIGTFFVGVGIIYLYVFRKKKKEFYLLMGFTFAAAILSWMKTIDVSSGLLYLGIGFSLLSGEGYRIWASYMKKTKLDKFKHVLKFSAVIGVILLSLPPAWVYAVQHRPDLTPEVNALEWIEKQSNFPKTVLAPPDLGHLITYIGKQKNIADERFILAPDSQQRIADIKKMYTTPYETLAIDLMFNYEVKYILFSEKIKKSMNIDSLQYTKNKLCFKNVFSEDRVMVFEKDEDCRLERVRTK